MGKKYAVYNSDGQITGFYDSADSPVPPGVPAIAITTAEWQQCLANPGYTVQAGALIAPAAPTPAQLLAQAQVVQMQVLESAYTAAIQGPVNYTSVGGIAQTYQANEKSVRRLEQMLNVFAKAQATPSGFYWVAADNVRVPFTFADLQGLAEAMGTPGVIAFQHLQTLKAEVLAASNVSEVQAIAW